MNSRSGNIHHDLVQVALEKVEGFAFESFAQHFLSALEGRSFIPVGGTNDEGVDGIYECGNNRTYYQFTRQENHRDKIRRTYHRLSESGRAVTTIYYLSSRLIPHIDKEEDLLTDELSAVIKIRDRKYIISHINDSIGTIAAYNNYLSLYTNHLSKIARSEEPFLSEHIEDPSAFVFLQHEVTNRLGDRKLIHSLTDTMILWSLSETDPDKAILMSEDEIRTKIFEKFPWTKKILKGHIKQRLELLRKKGIAGREIRWYRKQKQYCLPYETRESIKNENKDDESLKITFIDELKVLASELYDADNGEYQNIANMCDHVIHAIFEKQGLLFSHFLSSVEETHSPLIVSDCIDAVLNHASVKPELIEKYRDYIESIIQRVFYHGSPTQREYLKNLSRTYVLLFTLQAEPRIIEYFSAMSASFRLFIGSDILVKALSERYLAEEDQVARNLLKMSSSAGISMYLSECVLDEVYTHIRGTNYEFINYFQAMEPHITREIARNSDKILIRSYFYAKEEGRVKSWKTYLDQFMTYNNVNTNEGRDELKKYLLAEFNLRYMENDELESVCNTKNVMSLSEAMLANDDKKNKQLAYNTALLVHGVYGLRKKYNETGSVSEYGLKTWWMTNQSRVLRYTESLIRDNLSKYIMRPEYILNFIAMSPNCEEVRRSFKNIFPSNFGIQLGHRLKDDVFHKILADVNEWKGYEPGRIAAKMSKLSDELKSDRLKRYERTLREG